MNSPPSPPLSRYRQKRNFAAHVGTRRRAGRGGETVADGARPLSFVVQKHWASRLHYDFRLELDGVLLSWAVPKGPSFDPSKMQMAIHVEDHPLDYASFEGTIPPRQYGAGTVIVWDRGTWEPEGDPRDGMAKGKLVFRLHGEKLAGLWELVRIAKPGDKQDAVDAVQEEGRVGAAARRVRRDRGAARQRRRPAARPGRGARAARAPASALARRALRRRRPTWRRRCARRCRRSSSRSSRRWSRRAPAGDWIVETKFDGYRLMARIDKGKAKLITRGGHDWTDKMKPLAAAIESLGIASAWLDGEIVVMNGDGLPDFNALQNAIDNAASEAIEYFVFDLPFHDGRDLRKVPLRARRALLGELLEKRPSDRDPPQPVVPGDAGADARGGAQHAARRHHHQAPRRALRVAAQRDLAEAEVRAAPGVRDLRLHRPQRRARRGRQPLPRRPARQGALVYAGNVGTGWNARTARDLHARLVALETHDADARRSKRSRPAAGRGAAPAPSAGSGPSSSPRCRSASGRPRGTCAMRSSSPCASTSRRAR